MKVARKTSQKTKDQTMTPPHAFPSMEAMRAEAKRIASRDFSSYLRADRLASVGIKPTDDERKRWALHPATDWLLIMATQIEEEIQKRVKIAPEYVRSRHPQMGEIAGAIVERLVVSLRNNAR